LLADIQGRKRLRVLIADDHGPTREDVRRALEADQRFVVCAMATDAAAAVHAAVRERPDLCLLDVRMPGSGIAAAWEIAARLPEAKIVMLTVSDEDSDVFAALRARAAGYLPKAMDLRRLPDALAGVCSGEAAMPRALMARLLERFHGREPRWRHVITGEPADQRLTSREWEILELLAQGLSTAEIARRLVLSPSAVRAHIAAIVRKLGVANRNAAVALFRQRSAT
jgi:DNA-binding NarL/FixJ family response regulator